MADPQLTFLVQEPGVPARRVTTAEGIVKIGRNANFPLALTSPKVSRIHAVIEVQKSELALIDLGSQPQTTVNGVAINKHALRPGDRIEVADCVIVLEAVSQNVVSRDSPDSPEGAWNWGDAPAPRRAERSASGPIIVLALVLLGVIGFLILR